MELLGSDGVPLEEISSGDTLRIAVDYHADSPVEDWRAGIRIETTLAQVVYGTNTTFAGIDLPPLQGDRRVEFTVPNLNLAAGQYYVAGAIGHRDGTPIHQMPQGALLTVTSGRKGYGVVDLQPLITTS
jgi:hypothetical protein